MEQVVMEQATTKTNKKNIKSTTSQVQNEKKSIVIIESNGVCRTLTPKDLSVDTLYKKGGFINNDNFSKINTWNGLNVNGVTYNSVSIWGKLVGKSNNINKYILPNPLHNHKLFGACIIVHSDTDDNILSIDATQWASIYTSLSPSTSVSNSKLVTGVNICINDKPQTIKSVKNKVSNITPTTTINSNCVKTNTQLVKSAKAVSHPSNKPPIKRNKKKTQDTELEATDINVASICELTTEKYVFTDEE